MSSDQFASTLARLGIVSTSWAAEKGSAFNSSSSSHLHSMIEQSNRISQSFLACGDSDRENEI
jgi:hypothetical protein